MKRNIFNRAVLLPVLAACTLLSSCHSSLHRAVKRNDIYAVRREIAYAKTLNPKDKIEYLKGSPPASNLWWIVPTGMITIPVDICLLVGTLGLYAAAEDYWLSDILWYNFYNNTPDAIRISYMKSYRESYNDITYELMEAGASTPTYISDWMYKNYWRYMPVVVEAPEPPKPKTKPKPKSKPTTTTKSIGVGESIAKPGS